MEIETIILLFIEIFNQRRKDDHVHLYSKKNGKQINKAQKKTFTQKPAHYPITELTTTLTKL